MLTVTDKKGFVTTYSYDKNSRMKTVGFTANSLSRTTTYSYDRNGNRSSIVYDGGTKEEYTYDKDNRLTLLSNKRGDDTVISSYSYTYDLAGRIHTKTDSYGTTTYSYDADGRITQVEAPGKTSIYSYDKSGNRQSLNETYTSQQFSGYVDDTTTPQTNLNYLVKASEYVYSDASRLMQLVEKMYDGNNNEVVRRCTDYFYDANGNQTASSSAHMRVFDAGRGETFQITSSDEGAKVTAEVPAESKPLDTGNGASFSISSDIGTAADPLTKEAQAYKDTNAATAFSISGGDGSGANTNYETVEETVSNQYDGFNRLKKSQTVKNGCNVTVEYGYDGDDLRVKKAVTRSDSVNPDVTLFTYDGQNVILETDGGEAVKARYVLGVNYVGRIDADEHVSYMLYNGHGDVVQTVATSSAVENNYDYDVFGTPTLTVEGYTCPIRYAGEYYDSETGEYYLSSRYYDSFTGRFTTEDDPSYGKDTDPASLNLYSYCENDPIDMIDPTGHSPSPSKNFEGNGNALFQQACAAYLAGLINSGVGHAPVSIQDVTAAIQQGSTAIYYAVYGGSSSIQAAATLAIANNIAVPYDNSQLEIAIGGSTKDKKWLDVSGSDRTAVGNSASDGDFSFPFTLSVKNDSDKSQGLTKVLQKSLINRGNKYKNGFDKNEKGMLFWGVNINDDSFGHYTDATSQAVRDFQLANGLPGTGILDKATWLKMKLPDPKSELYQWMRDDWNSVDASIVYPNGVKMVASDYDKMWHDQHYDLLNSSTQKTGNGRTYSDDVDFHEWLYDPETDSGKYSLTTEYELAKLTIGWYKATDNRDRQAIGIILQVIQRDANNHNIREIIKKNLANSSKITPFSEAIFAQIEGGESIESLNSRVSMYKDVEVEIRNLTKGNEKQIGEYGDVGGHHIHAKSAFKDSINYDPKEGWSISQEYMREMGWDHSKMTAKQRELFKELADSRKPNILREHNRIAIEALKAGNVPESTARRLVAESLINLRQQGVRFPTRIPWNSPKAVLEENIVKEEEVPFK